MTNGATDVPATQAPAEPVLTPAQALAALFLANADRGANADNDSLVVELLMRRRAIQSLTGAPKGGYCGSCTAISTQRTKR
ncbi:MAG: hypothetical protein ACRDS0_22770 [Pseudonocardiaceae bacterium]